MKNAIVMTLLLGACVPVLAAKLDLSAHNSIIQKLESALQISNQDSMVQRNQLTHRLADLYAERARLLSMEQQGQGARIYLNEITSDRKKSIATLNKTLNSLDKKEQGPALLQMAHLHELLAQNQEALTIYKNINKKSNDFDSKTVALTNIKLGDFYYATGDMPLSKKHFENADTNTSNPRPAYVQYRLAWVYYNQGQTKIAEDRLFKILQTPQFLKNKQGLTDESFVDDLTHDLSLFLAQNDIDAERLKKYVKLSPERIRKKNLILLAEELDRTAKKQSALKVWYLVGKHEISFDDQIQRQVQITRIEYDLSKYSNVLIELDKALLLLKKSECQNNPICTLAKENLRRLITEWARAEDRTVSTELISALKKYTKNFEDYEISFWAAGLAYKKNKKQDSFDFYVQTAVLLKKVSDKNPQQTKIFEDALISAIELAENSKNPQAQLDAYKRYLEFNPKGSQRNEVRYQIARWHYDQNNYALARDEFKKLALDLSMPLNLREKAADLCLDTNVLLKDEIRIENDSFEFSQIFKNKKSEYLAIWRKSVLNHTAQVLNAKSSESVLSDELKKLDRLDSKSFVQDEKNNLLKSKMELSFRLNDVNVLEQNAYSLSNSKNVDPQDQQKAFHYLAWTSEIRMNFKQALKYQKKIQPKSQDLPEYYLKRALLKELSKENPTTDYEAYLGLSKKQSRRPYAAHQIVFYAADPSRAFQKHESLLRAHPDLYSSAGTFVYEKTKNEKARQKFAQYLLNQKAFKKTVYANLIQHQLSFSDFQITFRMIAQHSLKNGSDAQLKKSILQRKDLIQKLEKLANKSIARRDAVEQLVILPSLALENRRLATNLMALPLPRKLTQAEREQYKQQLKVLVEPYQNQSVAIELKIKELWNQETTQTILSTLNDWSAQNNRPGQKLALQELSLLNRSIQSQGLATVDFEKLSKERQKASLEAATLKLEISKNPFNISALQKMKSAQSTLGSGPLIAYINSRMSALGGEQK